MQSFSVFFIGIFSSELFVTQISQMTQIFSSGIFSSGIFSSDFTEFIRRFPAEAITHGFSRMRPVRSLQIPPEVEKSPTDFTDLHRFWTCSVFGKKHADFADSFVGDLCFFCPTDFTDLHRFWTCSVFGKKHADFADDAVFLFEYLGDSPPVYGKNESV